MIVFGKFNSAKTENSSKIQRNIFSRLYSIIIFFTYVFFFALAYWLAFSFRFDFDFQHENFALCYRSIVWVVLLKTTIFFYHKHFNSYWFYATYKDFQVLAKSSLLSAVAIYVLAHYFFNINLPRTVTVLDCIFTIFLIGSVRLGWRIIFLSKMTERSCRKTLIIGANYQGASLAHELYTHPKLDCQIVGFITVHPQKVGRQIGHIPILGHIDAIEKILKNYKIEEVLTFPEVLNGTQIRNIMTTCQRHNIRIRIVPNMETRLGNDSIPMRDIKIEDLLKRDPISLDDSMIQMMLAGKKVLVTGAGGSIGSEICRQIIKYHPKTLYILGRGENRIFFLEQELSHLGFKGNLIPIIADVSYKNRMEQIFETSTPDVVFHAAAHKHVPLMEANMCEAVNNNILGTKVVADLAHRFQVSTFVLISTDKAVNPTSIMGASKHMAERYVHAMSRISRTKFITTRFGNVLGSTGSVVPVFRKQIALGGPITVTDFRMTRYFMTIPEASQLVLQAASMGKGGEIFVLDMGEPVCILDLAKDLIRLCGLPENAIEICEVGMRPGEKLYEELYFDSEEAIKTSHPKLRCAKHRYFNLASVEQQIDALIDAAKLPSEQFFSILQEIVPEYRSNTIHTKKETGPKISIYIGENANERKVG